MGSFKFCRDLYKVTTQAIHAIHVEMIINVWKSLFQVPGESHPYFAPDGFRAKSSELTIITDKRTYFLEIPPLDRIQQSLYDFSRIHAIFLYISLNCF